CAVTKVSEHPRGILLGPPGQGKSFLAIMTASRLAAEALQCLEDPNDPADLGDVALPIVVSLPRVLALPPSPGSDPDAQAREAVLTDLASRLGQLSEEARAYLRTALTSRRVWLFLDGLDEEGPGSSRLRSLLHFTASVQGPVFLTGRPYGLTDHWDTI